MKPEFKVSAWLAPVMAVRKELFLLSFSFQCLPWQFGNPQVMKTLASFSLCLRTAVPQDKKLTALQDDLILSNSF